MREKNIIAVIISIILLLCSEALCLELPDDISSWHCVNEHIVNVMPTSTGENLGRIVYKTYMSGKSSLQIILTEGEGTGGLYVPEKSGETRGLMPSEAEYKILEVKGHKAIIEKYEHMPLALAINMSKDVILTIETFAFNEEEIIKFAENFIN